VKRRGREEEWNGMEWNGECECEKRERKRERKGWERKKESFRKIIH